MTIEKLYILLTYIAIASIFVPISVALYKRKAFNIQLRALLVYMIVYAIFDITNHILTIYRINNCALFNIFTCVEFMLLLFIYIQELQIKQKLSIFLSFVIPLLFIASIEFSFTDPSNITSGIVAVIMMGFSVFYFLKIFLDLTIPKLTNYYFFWLNSGVLIYFAAPFILSLFEKHIRDDDSQASFFLWAIQLFTNLIYSTVLTIGVCKIKRT
ncbi:MAG: hypothetical protein K0S33_3483 [Bacteroidetes bacterium]|jgi:hypothetical protein|nr:hypothetical protein [Bacteroidota bacterium]